MEGVLFMSEKIKKTNYRPLIIGAVLEIAITLGLVALFSLVMNLAQLDYKYAPVLGTVAVALGGLGCAWFISSKKGSKGYMVGGIVGLITFILVTLISLIVCDGSLTMNTLFHFIIFMLSSVTGGVLGVNKKPKKYI